MSNHFDLNGISSVFDTTLNNELQDNIIEFLDWGLLQKGNYFNVTLNELSSDSLDYSLLKKSGNNKNAIDWGEEVVDFLEHAVHLSALEVNSRVSLSLLAIVLKSDVVPFRIFIFVWDVLMDVGASFTEQILVSIGGEMISSVAFAVPDTQNSVSKNVGIFVGLLVIDGHSECKMPVLLLLQRAPEEPSAGRVHGWESLLRVFNELIDVLLRSVVLLDSLNQGR